MTRSANLSTLFDDCLTAITTNDNAFDVLPLAMLLRTVSTVSDDAIRETILRECADRISDFSSARPEYIILALHTLHAAYH